MSIVSHVGTHLSGKSFWSEVSAYRFLPEQPYFYDYLSAPGCSITMRGLGVRWNRKQRSMDF